MMENTHFASREVLLRTRNEEEVEVEPSFMADAKLKGIFEDMQIGLHKYFGKKFDIVEENVKEQQEKVMEMKADDLTPCTAVVEKLPVTRMKKVNEQEEGKTQAFDEKRGENLTASEKMMNILDGMRCSFEASFERMTQCLNEEKEVINQDKGFIRYGTTKSLGENDYCETSRDSESESQLDTLKNVEYGSLDENKCENLVEQDKISEVTSGKQYVLHSISSNSDSLNKDPAKIVEKSNCSQSLELYKSFSELFVEVSEEEERKNSDKGHESEKQTEEYTYDNVYAISMGMSTVEEKRFVKKASESPKEIFKYKLMRADNKETRQEFNSDTNLSISCDRLKMTKGSLEGGLMRKFKDGKTIVTFEEKAKV